MAADDAALAAMDGADALETMRRSAARLDAMMQRLCEATAASASDSDDDERSALRPAEPLGSSSSVTCDAYFDAIRSSFASSERKRVAHAALRELLGAKPSGGGVSSKGFAFRTAGVTYVFPPSLGVDDSEDEWDMVEALSLEEFQQRVRQCLESADHLMPATTAETLVSRMAEELAVCCGGDCELKAVDALFPTTSLAENTTVVWRRGNRICKVHATEREWRHQWGVEVVMTLETVVRAQGHSGGSPTSSRLGPPLSCSLDSRVFVPKALYKSSHRPQLLPVTILQLKLSPDKSASPRSTSKEEENTTASFESGDQPELPEFVDLYRWGDHSSLSNDSSSTSVLSTLDPSVGFQRLEIHTPFPRNRIVQAACGRLHTLLLNDAGMVFSFGHAVDGALGHEDSLGRTEMLVPEPRLVEFFFDKAITIRNIACGGDEMTGFHSAAVAHDGRLYTWGVGFALGQGSLESKAAPRQVKLPKEKLTPANVSGPSDEGPASGELQVVSVSCGSGFCIALSADGDAFAWGKWSDGRLGLGAIPILNKSSRHHGSRRQLQRFQLHPRRIQLTSSTAKARTTWSKVSCGDAHCVALSRHGHVYVWGRGRQGQLGLGNVRDAMSPVPLSKKAWREVTAGQDWTMAVDKRGAVWSWGACGASVLGVSSGNDADRSATVTELLLQKHFQLRQQNQSKGPKPVVLSPLPRFQWLRPRPIPSLSLGDVAIRSLDAGSRHAAAVSEHGDLYIWGSPSQGLSSQPTLVKSAATTGIGSAIAEQVFCGGDQVIAVTSSSFLASSMQRLYRSVGSFNEDEHENQGGNSFGADVALIVAGGRALFAHKLVLCRRSPVLRELILNEERPTDATSTESALPTPTVTEVLLPQLRLEIARFLLEFLYTDNLTNSLDPLSYLIRDVLRAAQEFQIPRLVRICQERIAFASFVPIDAVLTESETDRELGASDRHSLRDDLTFAFGDTMWSDLRIVAENRAIPVHRCMLVARSEYFRALLAFYDQQTPPHGGRELVVEESYLGMMRVLNFIYNDDLTTLWRRSSRQPAGDDDVDKEEDDRTDQLLEDLIAADKFGLVRMKRLCEHHIAVSLDNCVDVLVVADLVHAEHLKQVAMAFIQANLHVLSEPEGSVLRRLTHEFPHLLTELYDHLHRNTQQQMLLRDWQHQVERDLQAQQERLAAQWQTTSGETKFPWVALMLAFVFATLYLTMMNAQESDFPLVPAVNVAVVVGLIAAAFFGKLH